MSDIILKIYSTTTNWGDTLDHVISGGDIKDYIITDESNYLIDTARFVLDGKWRDEITTDNGSTTQIWRAHALDGTLINSGIVTKVGSSAGDVVVEGEGMSALLKRKIVTDDFFQSKDDSGTEVSGKFILTDSTYGLVPSYLGSTYGSIGYSNYVDADTNFDDVKTKAKTWSIDGVTLWDACIDIASSTYGDTNGREFDVYLFETFTSPSTYTLEFFFREKESQSPVSTFTPVSINPSSINLVKRDDLSFNKVLVRGAINPQTQNPKDGDEWTEGLYDGDSWSWWGRCHDRSEKAEIYLTSAGVGNLAQIGNYAINLSRSNILDETVYVIQKGILWNFKAGSNHNIYRGTSTSNIIDGSTTIPSTVKGWLSDYDDSTELLRLQDGSVLSQTTTTSNERCYMLLEFYLGDYTTSEIQKVVFQAIVDAGGSGYTSGVNAYVWNDSAGEWSLIDSTSDSYGNFDDIFNYIGGVDGKVQGNYLYLIIKTKDSGDGTNTLNLDLDMVFLEVIHPSNYLVDNRFTGFQFTCMSENNGASNSRKSFYLMLGLADKFGNILKTREQVSITDSPYLQLTIDSVATGTASTSGKWFTTPVIPLPKPNDDGGWTIPSSFTSSGIDAKEWAGIYQFAVILDGAVGTEIDNFWIDGLRFYGSLPFSGSASSGATYTNEYVYVDRGLKSDTDCSNMASALLKAFDYSKYSGTAVLEGVHRDFSLKAGDTVEVIYPYLNINIQSGETPDRLPVQRIVYMPNRQIFHVGRKTGLVEVVNSAKRSIRRGEKK